MDVANTDTLTYDAARGTYRHDMLAECSFRKEYMDRGDKRLPKNTRQLARTRTPTPQRGD